MPMQRYVAEELHLLYVSLVSDPGVALHESPAGAARPVHGCDQLRTDYIHHLRRAGRVMQQDESSLPDIFIPCRRSWCACSEYILHLH